MKLKSDAHIFYLSRASKFSLRDTPCLLRPCCRRRGITPRSKTCPVRGSWISPVCLLTLNPTKVIVCLSLCTGSSKLKNTYGWGLKNYRTSQKLSSLFKFSIMQIKNQKYISSTVAPVIITSYTMFTNLELRFLHLFLWLVFKTTDCSAAIFPLPRFPAPFQLISF